MQNLGSETGLVEIPTPLCDLQQLFNLSDSVFLSVCQGLCLSHRAVLEMKINHKSKLLVSSPVL